MSKIGTVSVVCPHYFQVREPNLTLIVNALRTGSRPPDEILIWNNDAPLRAPLAGARVVQSPWNLGCKARFLAALVSVGDWILFQDNDLMAHHGAVENLLRYAKVLPDAILSFEGRRIVEDRTYKGWIRVKGKNASDVQPIEITLGRMELMRRDVLMRLLERFPFRDDTMMDDLAFSVCARDLGVKCFAVPYRVGNGFSKLPTYDVGLSVTHRSEYYAERDRVAAEWFPVQAAGPCGG